MLKGIVSGEEKDIVRIPMKGKNLLAANGTVTINNVSVTITNGHFLIVGTTNREISSNNTAWKVLDFTLPAGTYRFKTDALNGVGFYIKNYETGAQLAGRDTSFALEAETHCYIAFYIYRNNSGEERDIMLNAGSQALPYEPYGYQEGWEVRDNQDRLIWGREDELQTATGTLPFKGYALPVRVKSLLGNGSQTGTPTPDNPVMPTFCGVRTGNLVNKTEFTGVSATIEQIDNGIRVIAGSGGYAARIILDVQENTDYTLSYIWKRISGTASNAAKVFAGTGGSTEIATFSNNTGGTFNTGNNTKINIWFYAAFGVKATVEYTNIMLNLGSTALPYEPYGWAEKITCAGQTVPVYLGQTQTVRRIKKLVFDGTEGWTENTSGENTFRARLALSQANVNSQDGYCSHLPFVASGISQDIPLAGCYKSGAFLRFDRTMVNNITDFKMYLQQQYAVGHPVTVWYVLATPETAIVNEPLCKISTYADELSSTVATLPEIPTTAGQNTLTVDTTLAPYEVTVEGHIRHGYWGKIREDVRSGVAQTKFPVGTIFYDNEDETTGTAFQVVGYDKHFDPEMTARGYTHSMTLCELKLTDLVTFDATEALLYVETAIAPGTYRFKIPNYDATYGGNKSYYFTTTKSIPVGGQITINWPYQQTPKTASTYSEIAGVTAIESGLTLSEWIEGDSPAAIDLGTAAGPNAEIGTSSFGKMNHIHRARYGSNNYMQSGIRQYINSDKAASSWWSPQTVFDRPYGSRTSAGKLTKLSSEFVDALVKPEIKSRTNSYFETDSLDGTKFSVSTDYTITTDKMFLLSPNEVGLNADTTIGFTLDYYLNATNADRIKHRVSNEAAYYWWLRTPTPTYAYLVRVVLASGTLNGSSAYGTYGVAAACVIQ